MSASNLKLLEKLLDYSSLKQKVISKNIANVTTVNYKREEVKFDELFSDEVSKNLKTTDSRHIPNPNSSSSVSEYNVVKDDSTENISGFNNVDINKEMADLAENSIMFKFGSKKVNGYFQNIRNVINGGGGR